MFLSQLILNPSSRLVRSELSRPYELHRTVMSAFAANFQNNRVLYRLEISSRDGIPQVLVQSTYAPDWSTIKSKPGYLLNISDDNPAVRPFQPHVETGQHLVFRLAASPTHSICSNEIKQTGKRMRGQRRPILSPEEQALWLSRKGENSGFRVCTLRITKLGNQYVDIPDMDNTIQHARHLSIRFDGELKVVDPERFLTTLAAGLGSAKGFGFGLLSIAPVR